MSAPRRIVVMGVAGSGKTTVARSVAAALGSEFVDADSLHSEASVAKMAAGLPLDDADRVPWLDAVRDVLAGCDDIVVACSALRRRYRDVLRTAGGVRFVYLDLDQDTATSRTLHRAGHFMGPTMVASQFEALEPPFGERDVVVIDATASLDDVVPHTLRALDEPEGPLSSP
jgi:gluconokinase